MLMVLTSEKREYGCEVLWNEYGSSEARCAFLWSHLLKGFKTVDLRLIGCFKHQVFGEMIRELRSVEGMPVIIELKDEFLNNK